MAPQEDIKGAVDGGQGIGQGIVQKTVGQEEEQGGDGHTDEDTREGADEKFSLEFTRSLVSQFYIPLPTPFL